MFEQYKSGEVQRKYFHIEGHKTCLLHIELGIDI